MNRIVIVGCGGAGKSYLARELGARLGIPVTHLDGHYYDADWNTLPRDRFEALQRDLAAQPTWVIDGNYALSLPIRLGRADTVIFLDLPSCVCLWGILTRRVRHGVGQQPSLGVYNRITWRFVRYILGYRRRMRPRVQQLVAQHAGHADVVVLRSRHQVRGYLTHLAATSSPCAPAWSGGRTRRRR